MLAPTAREFHLSLRVADLGASVEFYPRHHKNSHLDPRFQQAAGPVDAAVAIGPVEPFYRTRLSIAAA